MKYNSILEILESCNLQVEFQCRSGYCGTCRLKIIKGTVKYNFKPLAYINNGEILPCCCLPINSIELQFYF